MKRVYLVRHGQAGPRQEYDSLSGLGRTQSRLLGEYFVSQGIKFAVAYSGELQRQRQTAEEVSAAFARAGIEFPELGIDRGWNEFDLDEIYREIAPALAKDDDEFRLAYKSLLERLRASSGAAGAGIHRRWTPSDTGVVAAWISNRYAMRGETWEQFQIRVAGCRVMAHNGPASENAVVFTSATPTAIWAGRSVGIQDGRVMRLAGALRNTAVTVLRLVPSGLDLFSFNEVPHLLAPELRTYR